jgi:flavin-binding protein dodecin
MEKSNRKIQITDLIDDAINNAIARRQDGLSELTDEQAGDIAGGLASASTTIIKPGITVGIIALPQPTTMGLIAHPIPDIQDTFSAC